MDSGDLAAPAPQDPLLRQPRPSAAARTTTLAALLGRTAGRQRGSSAALVREAAAMQLEERRIDWAYSPPVVALDIAWNLAFSISAIVVLALSLRERPDAPLRVWIAGYAIQCLVHVVLVWAEYRRRSVGGGDSDGNDSEADDGDEAGGASRGRQSRFARRCESVNTIASCIWWLVGLYWILSSGEGLPLNAPKLYWLAIVFLAFDVFFAIFCVALAFVIGIALCCCFPCIIAILYAIAGQVGASEADIGTLPRYRYVDPSNGEQKLNASGMMVPIANYSGSSTSEQALLREDAECSICLTSYEDGSELTVLPCRHHYHSSCISKWLHINAVCPLCKYNILKGGDIV